MRTLQRVTLTALIATVMAAAPAPAVAQTAQNFPTKPVRLIIPFTAGSATDLLARRVALKMTETWGQQVVVDNRAGGGGTLATNIVAKATPDGYTLLVHSIAYAMNAALYSKLPYDPVKDLAGVGQISISTSLMVVSPALGVKSVKELIALAKQKPGQLNYSSSGVGSGTHLNGEQFRFGAGIDVVHVPYKGVPEALVDVMAGRIHYFLTPLVPALPFIRDGRLLPLAVTTARRTQVLPDVPTMAEAAIPGYEFQAWFGFFAPARTPRPIVEQISREIARVAEMPDVKERMNAISFDIAPTSPEEYDKSVRKQIEVFTEVAKAAGLIAK